MLLQQVINCDWFQVHGFCDNLYFHNMYSFDKMPYSSRQFRDVFIVYNYANEKVATIQKNPFSAALDSRMVIVQFANEVLYKVDWASSCAAMLRDFDITYRGLSRIDICADFVSFKGGREVQNFIRSVVSCDFLHNGRSKMHLIGVQTNKMIYETLKIGSPTSLVDVKLYNKTKEMQDVKTKPHIIESWKKAGYTGNEEIWRLEFSMKSNAIKILRSDTAELQDIDMRFLQFEGNIKMLFKVLYMKYFDFRVNDYKSNKSRMKRLDLFNWASVSGSLYRGKPCEPSNRADKIFLKKLHLLKGDLSAYPIEVQEAKNIIEAYFIHDKDLFRFYDEKIAGLQE